MAFLQFGVVLFFIAVLTLKRSKGEYEGLILHGAEYRMKIRELKDTSFELTKSICPNNTEELEKNVRKSYSCIDGIDENEKMMCEVLLETKTCVKPVVDSMESCVEPSKKGIYTYVMKTAYAMIDYICNLDGEHFFELTNPCILKKSHPTFRRCLRRLKTQKSRYSLQSMPKEKEICSFVKDFKTCFQTNLDSSCQSQITRETFMGLYNTIVCE